MTDEAGELRSELREFRKENDHQLNAIRAELTGLRTDLDAGFRRMDAGLWQMNDRLAILLETVEELQRRLTDVTSPFRRRRTLG